MESSRAPGDEAAGLAATASDLAQRTVRLYGRWADALRQRDQSETADLLQRFAAEAEALRDDCLARLRRIKSNTAHAQRAPRFAAAGLPFLSDPEVDELDAQIASRYQILAAVVRVEDMAFRALSHFSATSADPAVRDLAEALAQVQLSRTARLRRHRRAAYRRALPGPRSPQLPAPTLVGSESDLIHAACVIEADAVEDLTKIAAERPDLIALLARTRETLEHLQDRATRAGPPRQALSEAFDAYATLHGGETMAAGLLAEALANSKRAFAFYDAVVAEATLEDVMLTAQALSALALKRIQLLRDLKT